MQDQQEFQIELFNGTADDVLANIYINGKKESRGVILHPAQRVFLDRFVDINKK
jgi:hypothetical protein